MNKYLYFAFFCSIAIMLYLLRKNVDLKMEVTALKLESAHLKSEVFTLGTQLNRYEMTVQHFRENDSTLCNRFEEYMSNHTE
jgi:hypothetical protein